MVAAAARGNMESADALAKLCRIYWQPVYVFIRRRGHDPDQAQDLTQSFFAVLLEKNYLADANRQKGRFRSFLLTAVKHFLANEWDREHAVKRGGFQKSFSIDRAETELWYVGRTGEPENPEQLFERRWALSLLEQVLAELRLAYVRSGNIETFRRLLPFLNGDPVDKGYEALAEVTGMSGGALRAAVHRMRRKFRSLLRKRISDTVSRPEEIEAEIQFLLSAVRRS